MFEFSRPSPADVSLRSRMSERVLRRYEASGSKTSVREFKLGQLRSVGVRSVSAKKCDPAPARSKLVSGQPRLSALRTGDPKRVLRHSLSNVKRAASAILFQRMRDRFARLGS